MLKVSKNSFHQFSTEVSGDHLTNSKCNVKCLVQISFFKWKNWSDKHSSILLLYGGQRLHVEDSAALMTSDSFPSKQSVQIASSQEDATLRKKLTGQVMNTVFVVEFNLLWMTNVLPFRWPPLTATYLYPFDTTTTYWLFCLLFVLLVRADKSFLCEGMQQQVLVSFRATSHQCTALWTKEKLVCSVYYWITHLWWHRERE